MWTWTLLRAGSLRLDGGSMFGVVPKAVWSKLVQPDAQNRIPLQTNCLLLQRDDTTVLIESGFGDKWSDKERAFFDLERRTVTDALREVEIDPARIDHVIVTHLHFDHVGGLTTLDRDGSPISAFPHARIHVQQTEWDDALANKSTMTRTYLRSNLDPIDDQLDLADGETEILPGITVWPVPGHTWGHQAVRFHDDLGTVCFPGDVLPTINHAGPAFSMGYDMLPYENLHSKQALLEHAEQDAWRLVLDHEPDNPVVTVQRDDARTGRLVLARGSG